MIWEREAYNLFKQGLHISEIQKKLKESRGIDYESEDIDYAIELCADGPVTGYEDDR